MHTNNFIILLISRRETVTKNSKSFRGYDHNRYTLALIE